MSLLNTPGICKVISLKNGRRYRDTSRRARNAPEDARRNNNRYAAIVIIISRITMHRGNMRGINNYEITRGHKVYNKTRSAQRNIVCFIGLFQFRSNEIPARIMLNKRSVNKWKTVFIAGWTRISNQSVPLCAAHLFFRVFFFFFAAVPIRS